MGSGLTPDHNHSHPADVWRGSGGGRPVAFDVTNNSPLNPAILGEASQVEGAAALAAESHKYMVNDQKYQELVDTCENWGQDTFLCL